MEQKFLTAIHKDYDVWKKSSSGGAFTAISDIWFDDFGDMAVVYGCALDENLCAVHIRAESREERNLCRGSKYIQSNISSAFADVANDLSAGKFVLFSGTPCQISAIKKFLDFKNIPIENLLTVDVICHGVGSNRFFKDYISYFENKYNSKAVSCSFRAKSRPGKIQDMEITFANSKKYNAPSTKYDWFYSAYIKSLILRPSCFSCHFSKVERVSDITVADNWGNGESYKSMSKSLVLANTDLGLSIIKKSFIYSDYKEIDFSNIHQPHLHSPCKKPADYDEFCELYKNSDFLTIQKYLGNNTFRGKFKALIAVIVYKLHIKETVKSIKERLG